MLQGQLSVEGFLADWDEGNGSFAADPTNADLAILGDSNDANAVAELLTARVTRPL